MPGQVERWLETFMCTQYAELFDAYGFKTLQSVCQLQMSHLLSMGIPQGHCELIHQNVEVLRQSIQGQPPYRAEDTYFRSRMPHGLQNSTFDRQQMASMNMNYNQQMNLHGSYEHQRAMMQQIQGSRPFHQATQNPQQPYSMSGLKHDYPNIQGHMRQGTVNEGDFPGGFPRQPHPFPHGPGGAAMSQASMHHPHLHRNSTQNPQEVANNILQMASSTYPPNNTVQVPLSKGRSAPYHVPQRSGQYPAMSPNDSQPQHQQQIQQMQFTYPTSSPSMHMSPCSTMSPVSPASASVMSSPHSIHSGHNVPSPASIHSPRMGPVKSPGSDIGNAMMRTPEGSVQSYQQINSPQRNQYPVASPVGTPHSRMVSPVPLNQQLHVSSPSPGTNQFHQNYGDMTHMVSPSGSASKYSSCSNIQPSPGGQSVHHSNMSSPYTPGSHPSPTSPHNHHQQQHTNSASYITSSNCQSDNNQQMPSEASQVNPLQSLQKLCMLPETRVVDPKSVVNDSCAPSPHGSDCSRNSNTYQSHDFQQNNYQQSYNSVQGDQGNISSHNSLGECHSENYTNAGHSNKTQNVPSESAGNSFSRDNSVSENSINTGASQTNEGSDTQRNYSASNSSLSITTTQSDSLNKDKGDQFDSINSTIQNCNSSKNTEEKVHDQPPVVEEIKCQPKKMKLLRATNQLDSSFQSNEINQLSTELEKTVDDSSVGVPRIVSGAVIESNVVNKPLSHQNDSVTADTNITPLENEINDSEKDKDATEHDITADNNPVEFVQVNGDNNIKRNGDVKKVREEDVADSGLSESGEDSHLSVKKDVHVKTYSRADMLNGTRLRNQSAGSESDNVTDSDMEYEDHIGCDDIDNNFSDIEEIDINEINEEVNEASPDNDCDILSANKATDNHILYSPHWKKSRLNNLNSAELYNSNNGRKQNSPEKENKNGIRKSHASVHDIVENDDLEMDVPSPMGDLDSFGVENRGGTMFMTQSHRLLQRQRKTPLKYRDTSFFKGEFVFDDEDIVSEMQPKVLNKTKEMDLNHNSKKDHDAKRKTPFDKEENKKPLTNGVHSRQNDIKSNYHKPKNKSHVDKAVDLTQMNGGHNAESDSEGSEAEKLTDGNKTETASQRGSRKKTRVQQKVSSKIRHNISSNSKQINKKNKVVNAHPFKCNSAKSDIKSELTASNKSKVKPLNGLKNIRETRKRTRSCNIENDIKKEDNCDDKKNIKTESTSIVSDCDEDNDVILIEDDEEDASVTMASVASVKKESDISNVKAESEHSCDNKDEMLNQAKKASSRQIKSTDDCNTKSVIKKKINKNQHSKPSVKSKKKNSSKAMKKFEFESEEELDITNTSLKGLNLNRTQNLLKKKKKIKGKEKGDDFKGPLIRVKGSKDAPDNCLVINERVDTTSTTKTKTAPQAVATRIQISHLPSDKSVLIPQTSAVGGNQWICALCGKHSSYRFLGDLFGPYTVDDSDEMEQTTLDTKPVSKKRKSDENTSGANKSCRTSHRVGSVSKELESLKEVWVHESCSVWSDGVFLIGSRIYGLQEAIAVGNKTPCTHCLEMGAMIGCLNKGCKEKYHFSCAVEKDCYLDEENFSLLCPRHKIKKLKPPEPSTSTSVT